MVLMILVIFYLINFHSLDNKHYFQFNKQSSRDKSVKKLGKMNQKIINLNHNRVILFSKNKDQCNLDLHKLFRLQKMFKK